MAERDCGVTIAYLAHFLGVLTLFLTYYGIVASTPTAAEPIASQWGRCDEGGRGIQLWYYIVGSWCWSEYELMLDGFGCTMSGLATACVK